jgi:alkylhydroperoxidase/carboxymuconolactone decarboxylase family protein YurZ
MTSEEVLRRLTIADPSFCRSVVAAAPGDPTPGLDARSVALLRLGATISAGSVGAVLQQRVDDALAAGLGFDQIVASLLALAPAVGTDRIVAVAPEMSRALGYDVDLALEELGDTPPSAR